jgi:hypothetical protein
MAAAKIEVSKDDSEGLSGSTLYGVLGLSVLLGSANTATPFGASNAVALTVVDSEVFLPTSRIIKPKPVQTGQSTVSTYRY